MGFSTENISWYMKSTFNLTLIKFFCIKINMNLNHSYLLSLVDLSCKTCKEADPLYTNQLFITTYYLESSHFSLDLVHNKVKKTKIGTSLSIKTKESKILLLLLITKLQLLCICTYPMKALKSMDYQWKRKWLIDEIMIWSFYW